MLLRKGKSKPRSGGKNLFKSCIWKRYLHLTCPRIFRVVVFVTVPNKEQPKCPRLVSGWANCGLSVRSTMTRQERATDRSHTTPWTNPKDVTWSERNQIKNAMILFIRRPGREKSRGTEIRPVVARDWRWGEGWLKSQQEDIFGVMQVSCISTVAVL